MENDELLNRCKACNKLFNNADVDLLSDNSIICHECKYKPPYWGVKQGNWQKVHPLDRV